MRTFSRPVLAFSLVLASGVALPAFSQTPSAGNATTAPATHEDKAPGQCYKPVATQHGPHRQWLMSVPAS